jgi:hypothetical protein
VDFQGWFVQWTDDSNLLVVFDVGPIKRDFAVVSRSGRLLRRLNTPVSPANLEASWRRYGHQ